MLDYRYIAGLFDGEGNFCISKIRTNNGPAGNWAFRISLGMAYNPIIEELYKMFGGHLRSYKSKNCNILRWYISNAAEARWFLAAMYPLLIVKREHAEIMGIFLNTVGTPSKGLSDEARQTRELCVELLQSINLKKGKRKSG